MKEERETKLRLLASAKAEFMEKGYMSASLRTICRNAEVTTGALYFFFQGKEDLFASIVKEPLDKLYELMVLHYREEVDLLASGKIEKKDYQEDVQMAYHVVHYLYQYKEEIELVLKKAQGSSYEYAMDRFVEVTESHYRLLADKMSEALHVPNISDSMIHWVSHTMIDTFTYFIIHGLSEEEAMKSMGSMMMYMITGWFGMLSSKDI